ncbi:MAG: methyltransferase domain-containing protein [Alphaproteobacteria bacterium]|nr:MAG: methyltransferase domain-containing protein [Alphaproteobacteria bacterium]
MSLDRAISVLRAAGEPTRLRLLAVLSKGELTVTELTQIMGQSQPRISRHLKLMCEASLLQRFREGAWVFYRVAEQMPEGIDASRLISFVPFDDPIILRDLERLAAVKAARRQAAEAYFRDHAGEWTEIRSLHVDEAQVEAAMLDLVGSGPFDGMLDLGTGTGRILELFADRVSRGVGLDQSREMLALARTRLEDKGILDAQVRQGDLYALPFEASDTGAFDLVTLHQVLHFLDDPALALSEAARVLAPGGKLLIVDFAPHDLEELREKHAHHRLGFSDEAVQLWCDALGLELVEARHLPPPQQNGSQLTVSLWLAAAPQTVQSKAQKQEAQSS